jgi:hypothetical protein
MFIDHYDRNNLAGMQVHEFRSITHETEALKSAIGTILKEPQIGKKLKGELEHLRSYAVHVRGRAGRLIYHWDDESLVLFSFGPRQGIYK